ncbi:DUF4328 domain-containing protein [Nocardia takedensis]
MSTVVQPCARCGARWAVQGSPMHWCPRCRGVLLSPAPIDAPPERRNYRWVARRPDHRPRRPDAEYRPAPATAVPAYDHIPRWGLVDRPRPDADPAPRGFARLATRVRLLLVLTALAFGVTAFGELLRYLLLLRNRTRLIDPLVLRLSDALVTVPALLAVGVGFAAAIALVAWLVGARAAAYAAVGQRDPRAPRTLVLGCLIPVVNLLWPGVFLTELADRSDDPRASRVVRAWWGAWLVGGVLVAAALVWRTADSLQAQADGVLFTAFTDAWAAGLAVLTLVVVRYLDGRDPRGGPRAPRRWVVAADPAVPVIEPVQPGAVAAESPALEGGRDADEARIAEDRVTDREIDNAVDRRKEEVVAK